MVMCGTPGYCPKTLPSTCELTNSSESGTTANQMWSLTHWFVCVQENFDQWSVKALTTKWSLCGAWPELHSQFHIKTNSTCTSQLCWSTEGISRGRCQLHQDQTQSLARHRWFPICWVKQRRLLWIWEPRRNTTTRSGRSWTTPTSWRLAWGRGARTRMRTRVCWL